MKKEDQAKLNELLATIALDPRAVRAALGLPTEGDRKAKEREQEEFERWRARAIKRMRDAS